MCIRDRPETYRKMVKPYQARLYQHVKEKYHKKILLHSCGAIRPIIGDLIEIGVDAINPVQISATGMQPEELKREFGHKITLSLIHIYNTFNSFILVDGKNILWKDWIANGGYDAYKEATGNAK